MCVSGRSPNVATPGQTCLRRFPRVGRLDQDALVPQPPERGFTSVVGAGRGVPEAVRPRVSRLVAALRNLRAPGRIRVSPAALPPAAFHRRVPSVSNERLVLITGGRRHCLLFTQVMGAFPTWYPVSSGGSGEQRLADVPAPAGTRRYGEQPRAGVLEILVHPVVAGQPALHRDELGVGVPHVGDEEQPRVEPAEVV